MWATKDKQPGYVMLSVVVIGMILVTSGAILLQAISSHSVSVRSSIDNSRAMLGASSGLTVAFDCAQSRLISEPLPGGSLDPSIDCDGATIGSTAIASIGSWTNTYMVSVQHPTGGPMTLSSVGGSTIGSNNVSSRTLKSDFSLSEAYLHIKPEPLQNEDGEEGGGGQPISGITQVSAGTAHSCAVVSGQAYCWGSNGSGRLGDGTTTQRTTPVAVDTSGVLSGKTVTQVSAGDQHTCAIADGEAYCWGAGGNGRLGDGASSNRSSPVAVVATGVLSGRTVTKISAGSQHTCAVADGQGYCWGYAFDGRLGNGASFGNSTTPVAITTSGVLSGRTVTDISVGVQHACAVASGAAFCWGNTGQGKLGNGSLIGWEPRPVAVRTSGALGGRTVTHISTGGSHTCAIADERAYCWGRNNGKLGTGSTGINQSSPLTVSTSGVLNGKTITQISAGLDQTCAVADGQAYCWGLGGSGRLGDGATSTRSSPVAVSTSSALGERVVTSASTGSTHSCASTADGGVYCWGSNSNGRLGNGSTSGSNTTPVETDDIDAPTVSFTQPNGDVLSSGAYHTCTATIEGLAYCWGTGINGRLGNGFTSGSALTPMNVLASGHLRDKDVTQINSGMAHTCAIADEQAYCWGHGTDGRLGTGFSSSSAIPLPVDTSGSLNGKTVTQISTGSNHTCAIADGQAYCWGDGANGRLGTGTTASRNSPTPVDPGGLLNGKTVTSISAGDYHTCAVADGQAYCWGLRSEGRLGDGSNDTGSTLTPVAVDSSEVLSGKTATQISTGGSHTCVVASGQAYCWGARTNGQLGDGGINTGALPVPAAVLLSGKTVTQVSLGSTHTCAIADSEAYCWGGGWSGQIGNGWADASNDFPIRVLGELDGKTISQISAGTQHTCAIANNEAYCWGNGTSGQLGHGSSSNSLTPSKVSPVHALGQAVRY